MTDPSPLFRPAGSGTPRRVLAMRHRDLLTPAETGGAFLFVEVTVPPGEGAPLHRHGEDAEAFYLLSGWLTFEGADGLRRAGPGDCCWLPAGGAHAFRNEGREPARALVVVAPGIRAEAFFAALDAAAEAGAPAPESVAAAAAAHDLELLPG